MHDQPAGSVTQAGSLDPTAFVATTLNLYVSFFLMASNESDVIAASTVAVRPSDTVRVYETIWLPPPSLGGAQLTVAVLWFHVAVTFVEGLGRRAERPYSSIACSTCPLTTR